MSSRSLPYAHACIRSMLSNCVEKVHLRLIADNHDERKLLESETANYAVSGQSVIDVIAQEEVSDRLADTFPGLDGLRALHEGHPCWRKIIDPIALSASEDEIIVTDPDLYFPNQFDFEPTDDSGVKMMRQGPNCLYPPDAVRLAFEKNIRLANHVDIGVAQLRAGAIEPEFLDRLGRFLATDQFRSYMHIEAIIWSAIAMRIGGYHLDPKVWRCWERGRIKRLAVAAGFPGQHTLRFEPLSRVKCIHVSGPSKWWVQKGLENGTLKEYSNRICGATKGPDYVELLRPAYEREQRLKSIVRGVLPT